VGVSKSHEKNLVPTNEQQQTPTALSCCSEGVFIYLFLIFYKHANGITFY
jgi:hypothetical protein